jgi:hypothetical protein
LDVFSWTMVSTSVFRWFLTTSAAIRASHVTDRPRPSTLHVRIDSSIIWRWIIPIEKPKCIRVQGIYRTMKEFLVAY